MGLTVCGSTPDKHKADSPSPKKKSSMKRLMLCLVALSLAAHASAGLLPKAKIGIKAGVDYQTNDLKSALGNIDFDSSTGWFAGLQGDLSWGLIGIHPELIYSHNKFDVDGAGGSMKMNKLDLPVLLEVNLLGFLALQAGPSFSLMTDSGGKTEGTKWDVTRPAVNYAIGAEARIWKLSVSARYNGAFKKSEVLGYTTGKNRISTFQLGVGYYF